MGKCRSFADLFVSLIMALVSRSDTTYSFSSAAKSATALAWLICMSALSADAGSDLSEVERIDDKYVEALSFMGSNYEVTQGIMKATDEYKALIARDKQIIIEMLTGQERSEFLEMQASWEASIAADEAFYSKVRSRYRQQMGRENEISVFMTFARRYRDRAIYLGDYRHLFYLESLTETQPKQQTGTIPLKLDQGSVHFLNAIQGTWTLAWDAEAFDIGFAKIDGNNVHLSYRERGYKKQTSEFLVTRADVNKLYQSENDSGLPYILVERDGSDYLHFEIRRHHPDYPKSELRLVKTSEPNQ